MKKAFFLFLFIFALFGLKTAEAQGNGWGLGIMLGEPTGLSAKYWLNENNALDFGLGYSFAYTHSSISMHADYLYHLFDVIKSDYRFPVYYGFGVRLRLVEGDDNLLGARGVAGIAWLSDNYPVDVFLEAAPVFVLFPKTSLYFDMSVGARYYFK